jgi:uncharacterized protein
MSKIFFTPYSPVFFKRRTSSYNFPKQVHSVASINLDWLIESGIQGAIIDLDNTIISEDDKYLSPNAVDWIDQAIKSGIKIFILSNGKRNYRVKYWSQYLNIPAINPAKKPFPTAFRKAMKQMNLSPPQVIVIGDSRHTDILGAWIVGCHSIQVASLPHPPRWWEKLLGKYVQTAYPTEQELWQFQLSNYHENN